MSWITDFFKNIQNNSIQQTQKIHAKLKAEGDPQANWFKPPVTMTPTPTPLPQKVISPLPDPTRMPTATPSPTPFPQGIQRVEPVTPQDIPKTKYTNRNAKIEPKLWDAIMQASPSGDVPLNDYMKRMALALATQESGGGYNLLGDSGKSMGPYHIQRASVPVADRYDPKASTQLVFAEMLRNILKNGVPKEKSLRTWNWNSGYVPSWITQTGAPQYGPKYNVDIPQMATTSSFYRGQ